MVFSGWTQEKGRELWTSDGTRQGTRILIDLIPGKGSGYPDSITLSGRNIFFTGVSKDGKASLYRSDGTTKGTTALYALPAVSDLVNPIDVGGGSIAFQVRQSDGKYALLFSDGTAAGTRRVLKDLPKFDDVAASPGLGQMLGRAATDVYFSNGASNASRKLSIASASRLGLIAASTDHLYFGAQFERGGGKRDAALFLADGGRPQELRRFPALIVAGEGNDSFAWAASLNETLAEPPTWYRLDGKSMRAFNEGPIAYQIDSGGTNGTEIALLSEEAYRINKLWISDEQSGTLRHTANVYYTKVYDGVVTDSNVFLLIDSGATERTVWRYDRLAKKVTNLSRGSTSIQRRGDDEKGLHLFNGRLIFREKSADGQTDLFAFHLTTGAVERITDIPGGVDDSEILGFAAIEGSSLAVVGIPGSTQKRVVLVGPDRSVADFGTITVDDPAAQLVVQANESMAYISFNANGRHIVYAVNLAQKSVRQVFTEQGRGQVLGFSGKRLYFSVEPENDESTFLRGNVYVSSGTRTTTRLIGEVPFQSGRLWHMHGDQLIFLSNAPGYYTVSPSSTGFVKHDLKTSTKSWIRSMTSVDGKLYACTTKELIRLDGETVTELLSLADVGSSFEAFTAVVVSPDKRWLYASAFQRTGLNDMNTWKIVRVDLANPTRPHEVVAEKENDPNIPASLRPILTAVSGRDIILQIWNAVSEHNYFRLRDGVMQEEFWESIQAIHQTPFGIIAHWKSGKVGRIDPATGFFRDLPGVTTQSIRPDAFGVQFVGKTAATGNELFRYRLDTRIVGTLFNDVDADLSRDPAERGLTGWRVYVDRNDNGRFDRGETSTLTDAAGSFAFDELDPGTYKLRISTGANYQMTTGTVYTVRLGAGSTVRKKFGARAI